MAATLHCYHLAALLQPEASPSAGRLQLAAALSTLAQNLDVSTLPATLPEASARDTANGVILQEMVTTLSRLARGEPVPAPAGEEEKAPCCCLTHGRTRLFALRAQNAAGNATVLRFLYRRRLAGYPYDYAQLCDCRPAGARRNAAENRLRTGGALLATLLALLMIVFIQPHTESLVGLLAMTLPVMALSAG